MCAHDASHDEKKTEFIQLTGTESDTTRRNASTQLEPTSDNCPLARACVGKSLPDEDVREA